MALSTRSWSWLTDCPWGVESTISPPLAIFLLFGRSWSPGGPLIRNFLWCDDPDHCVHFGTLYKTSCSIVCAQLCTQDWKTSATPTHAHWGWAKYFPLHGKSTGIYPKAVRFQKTTEYRVGGKSTNMEVGNLRPHMLFFFLHWDKIHIT